MEVDKLPSSSRASIKEMTRIIPNKRSYPLIHHVRTSSKEDFVKQEFSPTTGREDFALATTVKEDKESRAVDYLLELSEGEDPNDKSFEERFKNVLLMPMKRETKRASNTASNGFVQISVPEGPVVNSDQEIPQLEKTQSKNSIDGGEGLEPKFVPYDKSFREEKNSEKPPLPVKKAEQQKEPTAAAEKANKGNIIRLSRLDRHERRKRSQESRDLKQKEKLEKLEESVKTTENIVKSEKPNEISEFADEPESSKKVVKAQPLVVKGTKGLTSKESKEMAYDMILMESMKDFKKKMTKHFSRNRGKLMLLNEKRILERKNSERSVETPRKSMQTLPLEDVVLMGRSVSYNKYETARCYTNRSPVGQVKQTEELPSARSHFSRKERNKSTENSPKMLQETSVDKNKDEVLFEHETSLNKNNKSEQNSGFDLNKEESSIQPTVEKNKTRVVSDLKIIRDHKLIKAVAMKKLGAEVYGRSVSLMRTHIDKEKTEDKMKEDLEDLYNKLSGRAIVSNLANLSHNHYHNHHHQEGFVLPQRKLEFVSKLPKIHSLKLQESVTTRLLRMGSDKIRTNSSSTNRFVPSDLLQPSNSEKEFNDIKLIGSQLPPGVSITKEGYMPSLQKGRQHAKSFNQKKAVFYKDGYPIFPLRNQQQTPEVTENSNIRQGPLYSRDEINYKNFSGMK